MVVSVLSFSALPLVALLVGALYTVVAAWRLDDWRPALFAVLLVLMSVHQTNELRVFLDTGVASASTGFGEYPETGVNLLAAASVVFVTRFVRQERELRADLRAKLDRERELRDRNEELDQFVSILSHDLRNPLQTASSRVGLLRERTNGDHAEQLAEVDSALERIDTTLSEAMTLARQQQEACDTELVDLADVATACWAVAGDDGATLQVDGPIRVEADRVRLRHILENLFDNAVQHNAGDVTVSIGPLDDGFYVEDDGEGIPEAQRPTVFEMGHSTSERGTGFGLSIVGKLADACDWDVRLTESDAGGARFEFDT